MLPLILICFLTVGTALGDSSSKGCGNTPADIVFVLDESGSIWGPHFTQQLDFVQAVIGSFDVGFNKTHIGVLTFADNERIIFQLGQFTQEDLLKNAVKAIKQKRGETYTNLALKRTCDEMFSRQHSRPWVRHVSIVITDGASNNPAATKREADLCHGKDIQVFAVGVGQAVDMHELEAIASSKEYVFKVDSYAALNELRVTLAWKACEVTTLVPPTTTTTEPVTPMIQGCDGQNKMDHIWSISELAGVEDNNHALEFIKSVTEDFNIDPMHVQVGLAPRFCEEGAAIRLMDHDTKDGFWRDLDKRRLKGVQSHKTIEYIRQQGFSSSGGSRSDALKFGIMIIDFDSSDWEKTVEEARVAKDQGIKLFVIGVGKNVRADKLRELASSPSLYFSATSYSELRELKTDLITTICQEIKVKRLSAKEYFERLERYFE